MNDNHHEGNRVTHLVRHNTISRKSVLKQSRRSDSFENLASEQPHAHRRSNTASASLLSSPYNSVDAGSGEKPTYRVSLLKSDSRFSLSSSTRRG